MVFEKRLKAYKDYSVDVCAYYGDRVHIIDGNHNKQETLRQAQLVTGITIHPATQAASKAEAAHAFGDA